jgi:hypothetical protein
VCARNRYGGRRKDVSEATGTMEIGPSEIFVDGAQVFVGAGFTAPVVEECVAAGFPRNGVYVLEGPTGDGTEEMVCVGSVDGDERVPLRLVADVFDAVIARRRLEGEAKGFGLLCHDDYERAVEYMKGRGYAEQTPIRDEAGNVTGFTEGIEFSTSY